MGEKHESDRQQVSSVVLGCSSSAFTGDEAFPDLHRPVECPVAYDLRRAARWAKDIRLSCGMA